jgi:hypothetical protein
MKPFRIVAMLSLLAVMAFTTTPVKDVKLQYVFKAGDQYALTQTTKQTIKQSIPAMGEVTVEVAAESVLALKIASLTPTGARIDAHYEKMTINTKLPMGQGDMNMDSDGADDNAQNKVVKSMMNKMFSFTITKLGIIEKVEGLDNLFTDFEKLELDDATLNTFKDQFQQSMNEKSMKSSLEQALISYSEKKVKVGDTWRSTSWGQTLSFPMQVAQTWSLKGADGAKASIAADGTIAATDKDKVVSLPNGIKSKLDASGKQALLGTVNPKTGWPTETKINSEVKGVMTLLAGGMIPADMEVPIETITESVHKILKK